MTFHIFTLYRRGVFLDFLLCTATLCDEMCIRRRDLG